jgi:hypothetical protein
MNIRNSKILLLSSYIALFSHQSNDLIVRDLMPNMIPKAIVFDGKLIEAKKWADKNGDNILLITRTGPYRTADSTQSYNESGNVELHANQYLIKNGSIFNLWQTSEIISDCITDMWMEVFPNSTSITDLDKNGVTETTIVYRYSCRGGVDPSTMKVFLHEGRRSYCLQGEMYLEYEIGKLDKSNFEFNLRNITNKEAQKYSSHPYTLNYGRYLDDLDFKNSPPEFLSFAKSKWIEYCDKDSFKQFSSTDYQESHNIVKQSP